VGTPTVVERRRGRAELSLVNIVLILHSRKKLRSERHPKKKGGNAGLKGAGSETFDPYPLPPPPPPPPHSLCESQAMRSPVAGSTVL